MHKQVVGVVCCAIALGSYASAQSSPSSEPFPVPVATGSIGVKAQGALTEIAAHIRAVAASGWQDIEATGTLTFPAGDTHTASLSLLGSKYARFDIEMSSGTRSVRTDLEQGVFEDEFGGHTSLLISSAHAGVVAFPKVWIDAPGSSNLSLIDQGTFTGTGQPLHRITIAYPHQGNLTLGIPGEATDLYFDPSTHLLLYSVDAVVLRDAPRHVFSQVMSYSNYQEFNGRWFPATLTLTLDGQKQWTLELSQVTFNTNPSTSTFSF